MSYDNYTSIRTKINELKPFRGNSCAGYLNKADSLYIYSYGTLIARVSTSDRKVLEFNDRYYSVTTSKLQNIIRGVFNLPKRKS
jgi:hypothetical protein